MNTEDNVAPVEVHDFIRDRIRADLASGAVGSLVTRFPPEPNG